VEYILAGRAIMKEYHFVILSRLGPLVRVSIVTGGAAQRSLEQ